MFGIGLLEICIIAVVAIVFVGPKKLPEMMRHLGRFFVQARKMSNEVRQTFDGVIQDAEHELQLENLKKIRATALENQKDPVIDTEPKPNHSQTTEPHSHTHSHEPHPPLDPYPGIDHKGNTGDPADSGSDNSGSVDPFERPAPPMETTSTRPKPDPKPESKPESKKETD